MTAARTESLRWQRCRRCGHKLYRTDLPPVLPGDKSNSGKAIEIKCSSCGEIQTIQIPVTEVTSN